MKNLLKIGTVFLSVCALTLNATGGAYAASETKAGEKCSASCPGKCDKKNCTCGKVGSAPVKIGNLALSGGYVRETASDNSPTAGYLTLKNEGSADEKLLRIETDGARSAQIHDSKLDDKGVMRMVPLEEGLTIKAGETVEFKPRGKHLMFIGVQKALKPKALFPVTFVFEKSGEVTLSLPVSPLSGAKNGMCKEKR